MIFNKARKIFALLMLSAICVQQNSAQTTTENLSAQLFIKKSDVEIERLFENRTATELKQACETLLKQGDAPEITKDFPNRVRLYRLAQITARKIQYPLGEAAALLKLGNAHLHNNQFSSALDFFSQSLAISEKENDRKSQADTLLTIAVVYRNQADYNKTLEFYTRALRIYEELNDSLISVVGVLSGIGAVYMFRGDYNQAEATHRRGLEIAEKLNNAEGIADALFHLGIVYRLRGNYGEALRHYHQARQIYENLAVRNPSMYPSAAVLRHVGGAYFLQGNLRLALDYANQSLALDEKRNDVVGKVYGIQFLAIIRVAEKKYREALILAEKTVPMYEQLGDNEGLARSLALLGNIHLSISESEKSLDYFRRALNLREASGNRDGMAIARIGMARVFLAQGKSSESLALASQAAESVQENGNRELLWQAQSVIGQAYLARNECDKTRNAFDAAIATIESLRGEIVGGASENSLFFAERIKPYQQLAAMLAGRNDFAEAFEYAERAKARVLLDAVRFGRNQPTASMTAAEQSEENRLRGDVNSLNAQISKLSSPAAAEKGKLIDLKTKLEAARTALARFQTNIFAAHPELRIRRGAVKPIEINEIGKFLDEKSALLEYLVADDSVLLFVFTKSNETIEFKTYRIDIGRRELAERVGRFRQMLAERNVLFGSESRRVYDFLLRPAATQLAGKTSLTIVPDDNLWELPFQALQTAENRYVLDEASVSYSPSLTILREQHSNPKQSDPNRKSLLAFGNPIGSRAKTNAGFAALPEAEKQTFALKNLYGSDEARIFNRSEASETTLKRETADGFSILHLATHGVLDNNSPLNSYVLLASNQTSDDDGKLEAWEILEMNLASDLIVLSACETARGQSRAGEGLVGLAWSLMVAGARNVVVSQWKVDAASTTDLTIEFYKSFKATGAPEKPEALRRAALKLRRHSATAHPFYWAGFVLIGEAK